MTIVRSCRFIGVEQDRLKVLELEPPKSSVDSRFYQTRPEKVHQRDPGRFSSSGQFDVPIGFVQEMFPRPITGVAQLTAQRGTLSGLGWRTNELHVRLLRSPAAFSDVAAMAGTDDVLPSGRPTL